MALSRTFRSRLRTAAALILFLIIFLSFFQGEPSEAEEEPTVIKHPLADVEDIGLAFPYDPVPRRDFATLSRYPAHNIKESSKYAFALFYCDRQPDLRGPYFEGTQSIVWRLLWSPYRSKYPVIVFVCPFIPEANRKILRGQGAIVKEIELLDDIIPDSAIATKRWLDVLSKLNLWKEVDWQRLVFLDSDAFPLRNIDEIFDIVPVQRCKVDLLSPSDQKLMERGIGGENMCNYVYAGVPYFGLDFINAGFIVLKPNLDMHAKLLKAARSTDDYRVEEMEQGVLNSKNAFAHDGPFPVNSLPRVWNALPEYYRRRYNEGYDAEEGHVRVLHAKMFNQLWGTFNNLTDMNDMWDLGWMQMCRFYDDENSGFVEARKTGVYKTPFERWQESQRAQGITM